MKLSFSIPGILPSSAPQQVPIPSGLPAEVTGGLDVTGKAAIELGMNLLFGIAAVIVVVMLVFSGIQWITSGGDPLKIAAAKKRITYSIIGLIVVVSAFLLVSFIYTTLTGQPNAFLQLGN